MQTSCGFGVPLLTVSPTTAGSEGSNEVTKPILKDRETLGHWASKMVKGNTLHTYHVENNAASLDGLRGLKAAERDKGVRLLAVEMKATYKRNISQREPLLLGMVLGMAAMFLLMTALNGRP